MAPPSAFSRVWGPALHIARPWLDDVTVNKGQLYGVDAGEQPGWSIDKPEYQRPGFPPLNSPSGGYVFKINLL